MYFQAKNLTTGELSENFTYRCGAELFGKENWPGNFEIVGGPAQQTLEQMVRGGDWNNCE